MPFSSQSGPQRELAAFADRLGRLKARYRAHDFATNRGIVISPRLDKQKDESLSVKLVIDADARLAEGTVGCRQPSQQKSSAVSDGHRPQSLTQPISFTCNLSTSIEHIISHVVCAVLEQLQEPRVEKLLDLDSDDEADKGLRLSDLNMDEFILKVYNRNEYFATDSTLSDYQYVHQCLKFNNDVHLTLNRVIHLKRYFARTAKDDSDFSLGCNDLLPQSIACLFGDLNVNTINIYLQTFESEIEKLRNDCLNGVHLQSQALIQSVKAICSKLSTCETTEISDACNNLTQLCSAYGQYRREDYGKALLANVTNLDVKLYEIITKAVDKIKGAVQQLFRLYSRTFPVNLDMLANDMTTETTTASEKREVKDVSSSMDILICYLAIVTQLSADWLANYKEFKITCELIYGQSRLASVSSRPIVPQKSFFQRLVVDEWLSFDTMPLFIIPRETRLQFSLVAYKNGVSPTANEAAVVTPTNSAGRISPPTEEPNQTVLAAAMIHLFDFEERLSQGSYLLPMWTDLVSLSTTSGGFATVLSSCYDRSAPILQIQLPELEADIKFPTVNWDRDADVASFRRYWRLSILDSATQNEVAQLLNSNPLEPMAVGDKEKLWDRRHYLYDVPHALPKILLSAHSWEWANLAEIYSMVKQWSQLSAIDAMQLLLPNFPDVYIRQLTIDWIKQLSDDEMCDFLPQLVQSLRYDAYLETPLVWLLLERSLTNIRIGHNLYWLLKQYVDDSQFSYRARIYLNSLIRVVGKGFGEIISREDNMIGMLSSINNSVKTAKDSQRLTSLLIQLEQVRDYLEKNQTCLPLSPSMEICGLDVKSCSYFTSNTLPLKLVFKTPQSKSVASQLEAIYKQDMLVMQIIEIMDKLWLKEGLDLRMVTFGVLATDDRKGFVEMVKDSETLRKIQTELGLTGSFKDRPIAEWLIKHNTTELKYATAVDNFTLSTAGYSVATYILGVCDRHNDNIMLTTSGHLFHIDFGKFLGDSQMIGAIRRDRVPFVLTSDMAFVINGGDKPSKQFQFFIDVCCQAFNIIRRNSNLFMSLFALMISSSIPGVTRDAVRYVHKALMLHSSEAEANSQFTKLIRGSLKSKFTQINFFMHNLAQLRFTGDHNDNLLLSFVPKTFTKEMDGKIDSLQVVDIHKKYDPEKVYYYVIKVERQHQTESNFVFRTFREFCELQTKLSSQFPLAKFRRLDRASNLRRQNTREVASERLDLLSSFLAELQHMAFEISHCDLVYTFFHPILRDQEGLGSNTTTTGIGSPLGTKTIASRAQMVRQASIYSPTTSGQVKLSIVYKNATLTIMIMHAKNLTSSRSQMPDTYVKTYLLPDANKTTKRKTKVVNRSCHPTFMELIVYHLPFDEVRRRVLQVSIWEYDMVSENQFLGAALIKLAELNLRTEVISWYPLETFN